MSWSNFGHENQDKKHPLLVASEDLGLEVENSTFREFPVCNSFLRISPEGEMRVNNTEQLLSTRVSSVFAHNNKTVNKSCQTVAKTFQRKFVLELHDS